MQPLIDVNAYLRRIRLRHPAAADRVNLEALVAAHVASIAYENLDPLLGVAVDLDLAALQAKLVHGGRGGYCFEQNLLFAAALRSFGYDVGYLIARVLWNQPEDAITGRTHMLLRVELDSESWLVDVGFGGQGLNGALRLIPDVAQPTRLEPFRLTQSGDDWRMQALVHEQWLTLYRFDLHPAEHIDYVISNHFVSTHATSRFVNTLNAARIEGDRRLSLFNHEFTIRRPGHEAQRRVLSGPAEIRQVLEQEFQLRLPTHPQLDRRLEILPA